MGFLCSRRRHRRLLLFEDDQLGEGLAFLVCAGHMKGLGFAVLGKGGIALGRSSVIVPDLCCLVRIYFGCNYGYVLTMTLDRDGLALLGLVGPAALLAR